LDHSTTFYIFLYGNSVCVSGCPEPMSEGSGVGKQRQLEMKALLESKRNYDNGFLIGKAKQAIK
jgi:hypothetical protein